jgi:hypothetical protein
VNIWVPDRLEQACKCFSDEEIQLTTFGDLVDRWRNLEQAPPSRIFKSSFAENISMGFYAVAITSRQKTFKPLASLKAWLVVLFTICTMKNKSTFGVSKALRLDMIGSRVCRDSEPLMHWNCLK